MSNEPLVAEALARLGVTKGEMRRVAKRLLASAKLDQIGHAAAIFTTLLGPPATERPTTAIEATNTFADSVRRSWVLPIWPTVDFVIHEHPQGWAWGERFEQRAEDKLPTELDGLQPWRWCENLVVSSSKSQQVMDRWTDVLDITLSFVRARRESRFHARFDFGLLQSFTRV